MKHNFQIMVSGTIETPDEDQNGSATAAQKVANVLQHIPSFMGGDTGLTFDTMTSGVKRMPDALQGMQTTEFIPQNLGKPAGQ